MENNRTKLKTFKDYKKEHPSEIQRRLQEIRQTIKSVVPEAEERISYNMPSFWFHGNLVYYGAFKHHIGFYPASRTVFDKFKDELGNYKQSGKGTVQFPHDKPLPLDLIKKIVQHRVDENIRRQNNIS